MMSQPSYSPRDSIDAKTRGLVQFAPRPSEPRVNPHACVLCAHRKVKCDRLLPTCSNCIKSKHECEYRVPPPPQRRKRKAPGDETVEQRLGRAVQLLRAHNIDFDAASGDTGQDGHADSNAKSSNGELPLKVGARNKSQSPTRKPKGTLLMLERGRSQYLEGNFWQGLKEQVPNAGDLLVGESDDEPQDDLVDGVMPPSTAMLFMAPENVPPLYSLHPTKDIARKIWKFFTRNVSPLVMIFHVPTKQQEFEECIEKIGYLSRAQECFLFAIYHVVTFSLTEEECRTHLGEEKSVLAKRYQEATRMALIAANLLRTLEIGVLQSYVLYLICMRIKYDVGTFWTLTGVGVRIAQRIGLHRDGGQLGISAFEAEIRRRTWWPLLLLDLRATELAGAESVLIGAEWDAKMPANVNDSELSPDMEKLPEEHAGATDMIHCRIRYEMFEAMRYMRHSPVTRKQPGLFPSFESAKPVLVIRDSKIDELQHQLEDKYLRYCDVLNPLHLAASVVGRTFIAGMRLMTHHPRIYSDKGASMPQSEKDMLFDLGIKVIEYFNICLNTPALHGYLWHVRSHATWHPLIYIIGELRHRPYGRAADHGWAEMEKAFPHLPILEKMPGRALFRNAMTNIILRAWEVRQSALEKEGKPSQPSPFIEGLLEYEKRQKARIARKHARDATSPASSSERTSIQLETPEMAMLDPQFALNATIEFGHRSDGTGLDWHRWDELIQDSIAMPTSMEESYFNPAMNFDLSSFGR